MHPQPHFQLCGQKHYIHGVEIAFFVKLVDDIADLRCGGNHDLLGAWRRARV